MLNRWSVRSVQQKWTSSSPHYAKATLSLSESLRATPRKNAEGPIIREQRNPHVSNTRNGRGLCSEVLPRGIYARKKREYSHSAVRGAPRKTTSAPLRPGRARTIIGRGDDARRSFLAYLAPALTHAGRVRHPAKTKPRRKRAGHRGRAASGSWQALKRSLREERTRRPRHAGTRPGALRQYRRCDCPSEIRGRPPTKALPRGECAVGAWLSRRCWWRRRRGDSGLQFERRKLSRPPISISVACPAGLRRDKRARHTPWQRRRAGPPCSGGVAGNAAAGRAPSPARFAVRPDRAASLATSKQPKHGLRWNICAGTVVGAPLSARETFEPVALLTYSPLGSRSVVLGRVAPMRCTSLFLCSRAASSI